MLCYQLVHDIVNGSAGIQLNLLAGALANLVGGAGDLGGRTCETDIGIIQILQVSPVPAGVI